MSSALYAEDNPHDSKGLTLELEITGQNDMFMLFPRHMEGHILVHNTGEVATLNCGKLGVPLRGAEMSDRDMLLMDAGTEILFLDGKVSQIESQGTLTSEWEGSGYTQMVDAQEKAIIPAFVDSHAHMVWAGDRSNEITLRSKGLDYSEISNLGGGIRKTVSQTRRATRGELSDLFVHRLRSAKALGTARIECKSGYGLDVSNEIQALEVMGISHAPISIDRTWLGAHDIPPNVSRGKYLEELVEEQLPLVCESKLAEYVDVFCEPGWFTKEETIQICEASSDRGLEVRLHVDEFQDAGGLRLATDLGAVSADHVAKSSMSDREYANENGTMQTFLPGTQYVLGNTLDLPLKECEENDIAFAMASDYNPNCPSLSMPFVGSLAVHRMGLNPLSALVSVTRNPGTTLSQDVEKHNGTIEIGRNCSILVLPSKNIESWVSSFGSMNNLRMIN